MTNSIEQDLELRTRAAQAYEEGQPIMSDAEFDALNASLVQRGVDDPIGHGYKPVGDTVPHEVMMGTLVKAYTVAELFSIFGRDYESVVLEPKFDGSPLSLTYQDGQLVSAVTRGDGWNGKDRTEAARNVPSIPETISTMGRVIIRGEVVLPFSLFEALNEDDAVERTYKSTRAAVPGILASNNSGTAYLTFYPYWASKKLSQADYDLLFSHREFETTTENTESGLLDVFNSIREKYSASEFPFDGIVVKHDVYSSLEDSVAYKFENEGIQTTLRNVIWQTGRTGRKTPVAIYDPVSFRGEETVRASLHNVDNVRALGLCIGDTIIVESAGEIIPQVTKVVQHNGGESVMDMQWDETEGNVDALRLAYALSILGVKNLGVKYTEKYVEAFGPESIMNLVARSQEDIDAHIERFSGKNVHRYLEPVGHVYDYSVLACLGLDKLGRSVMKNIMEHFDSISDLVEVLNGDSAREKLNAIDGIGPNRIDTLIENRELIGKTVEEYEGVYGRPPLSWREKSRNESADADESNPVFGKVVVVTGTFPSFTRGEVEAHVRALGGKNGKSVSSKTDLVIAGAKAGSKESKARSLGVDVMSAEEFEALIV